MTFPKFLLATFSTKKNFFVVPGNRTSGLPGNSKILKFSQNPIEWYLVGKFRLSGTLWWKNYQNRFSGSKVIGVWSCPGTMTSKFDNFRWRRHRHRYQNLNITICLISLGDHVYQNSASYHIRNKRYKPRVTLTPPVTVLSKKPSRSRVKTFLGPIDLIHIFEDGKLLDLKAK